MKQFRHLSTAIVAVAVLLILQASASASSITTSSFELWNLQVFSTNDGTWEYFNAFSGTASVSDSLNDQSTSQRTGYTKYLVESVKTANEYASAEAFMKPADGTDDIGGTASVNIPFTTDSLFEATAGSASYLNEGVFTWMENPEENPEENPAPQNKAFVLSFDYQSILEGFSSDQFGFFDSSLSVNIRLKNLETDEIISLFSLNDAISGRATTISHNSDTHFEHEFMLMMDDANFYEMEISIAAHAYASTQGTPEPSAILLLGTGLIMASAVIRRKNS